MTATPTPAHLLEDDLKQLQDAIAAGPTPGPRICLAGYGNHGLRIDSDTNMMLGHVRAFIPSGEIRHGAEVQMRWEEGFANVALIAACYPERIARLLAHIAELDAKATAHQDTLLIARQQIRAAQDKLSEFRGDIAVALCKDCESGVKWLNEKALNDFKSAYPNLYAAIASEAKG